MRRLQKGRRVFNLLAALAMPCVGVALVEVLVRTNNVQITNSWWTLNACALAGFIFLMREFRGYALILAVLYFPLIQFVMLGFGLAFAGMVYGDFL